MLLEFSIKPCFEGTLLVTSLDEWQIMRLSLDGLEFSDSFIHAVFTLEHYEELQWIVMNSLNSAGHYNS